MCLCFYLSLHLSLPREMCGNIVVWSSGDTGWVGGGGAGGNNRASA